MVKSGDRIRAAVNVLEAEDGVMNVVKIGGVEYEKKKVQTSTSLEIDVNPMGAVRMTQRGKFVKESAKRYLDYKKLISWEAKKHFEEPITGAIEIIIVFYMQEPKRMPKGRTRPVVKPDIDNMVKGVMDGLNKIAWNDDNQVVKVIASKVYGTPRIFIDVAEIS